MIRRALTEPVLTAIIATLKGTSAVTTLATGGVWNHVPEGTAYPYVIVRSPAESREDTLGRFGASLVIEVQVVSQASGDLEGARLLDQCIRALNFAALSLTSPAASLGVTWENSERYAETINGLVTRHHVGLFRAWAEQTA